MAEDSISTPRLTGKVPDYFATPESWEMRADTQTPAQNPSNMTTTHEEVTPPQSLDDGWSDSLGTCMDFGMYETPPGAYLYRDQCAEDSFEMSCQEMGAPCGTTADVSYGGGPAELTPRCSPPSADQKEELASQPLDSSLYQDEQNHNDVPLEDRPHSKDSAERYIDPVDSELQEPVSSHKPGISPEEYEECIFERLDRQHLDRQQADSQVSIEEDILTQIQEASPPKSPTSLFPTPPVDDTVTSSLSPLQANPSSHQTPSDIENVTSPKIEPGHFLDQHVLDATEAVMEYGSAEKEDTDHCEVSPKASPAVRESDSRDEMLEHQEEIEAQARTGSACSSDHMNSSLMSMGAPHDAQELDQLADFLNMDDPFEKHPEPLKNVNPDGLNSSKTDGIGCEVPESVPVMDDQIIHLPTPPKRRRRAKKANAVVERRRSVRIARRESLLSALPSSASTPSPAQTSQHGQQGSSGIEQVEKDRNKMERQSDYVPHPFPEVGMTSPEKSTLLEHCRIETVPQEVSTSQMRPDEVEIFEHLNIDLPMPQKKKKTKGRRRSVRLSLQKIKVEEDSPPVVAKPVEESNAKCDSGFLADFADFGLGDDWMPGDMFGESQFAKTPKERSSRRKSARLSGVPIPLLQLTAKSEVRVICGEEEESRVKEPVVIDEHIMEDAHLTSVPEAPLMDKNPEDVLASGCEKVEVQPLKQKKRAFPRRRRSIRFVKQPLEEAKDTDSLHGNIDAEPSKVAVQGKRKRKAGTELNVLQEVNVSSRDNIPMEPLIDEHVFTSLKSNVEDNTPMDVGDLDDDIMDTQETIPLATNGISKDTPLIGRKRVSRITEKDKENDDALEQRHPPNRDTPSVGRKQRKRTASLEDEDDAQPSKSRDVKASGKDKFQVPKKIKEMYLKKGGALKKHNLETIFESPKPTAGSLLGGKKMKRTVAFTETPWLGRTGRTKGRKVKKGKPVKRVLSSKVEKSWKLDMMLSSLEDHSP